MLRGFLKNLANKIFGFRAEKTSRTGSVIRKAAIIGAGAMGSGLAAQLANAGIEVVLLDKYPGFAQKAVDRMLNTPGARLRPGEAKRISAGNTDDDMARIANADWIIEAVPDVLSIKQDIFKAINQHRKRGSIVSSTTSTIPLSEMIEGTSKTFQEDFMITHFPHPDFQADTVEIIAGQKARLENSSFIRAICMCDLGKKVVYGPDWIPPEQHTSVQLADIKRKSKAVAVNNSASLWDLGDGVLCAELHGMKNSLDPDTVAMLNEAVDTISGSAGKFRALVIYSDDKNFAVGANLGLAARVMNMGNWDLLDDVIGEGQHAMQRLKFAPFPVIGAVAGRALGGGCEILLHCDGVQAHEESYIGLVETAVGLVPSWGGCKEYLLRAQDAHDDQDLAVRKAFKTIMFPHLSTSTSAQTAKKNLFLRDSDGISMNRDSLLADAKTKALGMVRNYAAPAPRTLALPGPEGKAALRMVMDDFYAKGDATWHDIRVAEMLAHVLTGGDTTHSTPLSETDVLRLEREAFVTLAKTAQTRARIKHTLNTGKPLREDPLTTALSTADLRGMLDVHTPKDRMIVLTPDSTAPIATAGALPDTRGMKPMDAVITIMRKDGWMPVPPTGDGRLTAAFNEAAQQTKQGTIQRMNKKKSMAGFLSAEKIRAEMIASFDNSIQKSNDKIRAAHDDEQKIRLQAAQMVMMHYRDVVKDLTF